MNMLKMPFDPSRDHYQGSLFAPVELVEYGNFQSRHCAEAYSEVKLLIETLGKEVRLVYRHYPLHHIHPLAIDAAISTEAAAPQGKFWAMHDMIFERQRFLLRSSFSVFAGEMDLDLEQYENIRKYKKLFRLFHKVINDLEGGVKSGVDGVPTFYINGQKYSGFNDFEGLYRACKHKFHTQSMITT